jgi:hypothetical protein
MGFFQDLKNGDMKSIILVIFGILLFNLYWRESRIQCQCKNKEPMTDLSTDIKQAVKQVYLADVQAIRNLSEVATKLQRDGLTIPGDLTVTGKITTKGEITAKEINNEKYSLSGLKKSIDDVIATVEKNYKDISDKIKGIETDLTEKYIKYQDKIKITNHDTGNHDGGSKQWIGLCGHGDCGMVNVVITDQPARVNFRIEKAS